MPTENQIKKKLVTLRARKAKKLAEVKELARSIKTEVQNLKELRASAKQSKVVAKAAPKAKSAPKAKGRASKKK